MTTMRLYRGLTKSYRPEKVVKAGQPITATDFTDCPFTALRYAQGARGVLLVIDIDADSPKVREELWLGMSARRFMVWGGFDRLIVGTVPAKDLRTVVRRKGIVTYDDSAKARILRREIEGKLQQRDGEAQGRDVSATPSTDPRAGTLVGLGSTWLQRVLRDSTNPAARRGMRPSSCGPGLAHQALFWALGTG